MLMTEWKLGDALIVEREEGREERDRAIAKNALAEGAPWEFIPKITGFDLETIRSLCAAGVPVSDFCVSAAEAVFRLSWVPASALIASPACLFSPLCCNIGAEEPVAANYAKPDFWALKAQKEGYPARSVYKLEEMDKKFDLLNRKQGFKVLDLGAAPGSWSLYILRKLPPSPERKAGGALGEDAPEGQEPLLVSLDLISLSRQYDRGLFDREDFRFIKGDMTNPALREAVLALGPYHLILSDAAPATTGNPSVDSLRSLELAEAALSCVSALARGGSLAVKVFQGGDSAALLRRLREGFESAKSFKPQACRRESFETYYLGLGKKQAPFSGPGASP
jgi:23S rRNA (uridine2552-2'-O)-methyltransferase